MALNFKKNLKELYWAIISFFKLLVFKIYYPQNFISGFIYALKSFLVPILVFIFMLHCYFIIYLYFAWVNLFNFFWNYFRGLNYC